MRYARMSALRIQARPEIGHQWRKVRLRKPRGAGGADSRGRPKGAREVFGLGAREVLEEGRP